MKNLVATLAAVAAIGCSSAAMAQSAMQGDAMQGSAMHGDAMKSTAMMASMACRPAMAGETATGKLASGASIVCKTVDMDKMMKGPSLSDTPTAEDKAWRAYLTSSFYVPF